MSKAKKEREKFDRLIELFDLQLRAWNSGHDELIVSAAIKQTLVDLFVAAHAE